MTRLESVGSDLRILLQRTLVGIVGGGIKNYYWKGWNKKGFERAIEMTTGCSHCH
jgi:hypothetical protein